MSEMNRASGNEQAENVGCAAENAVREEEAHEDAEKIEIRPR